MLAVEVSDHVIRRSEHERQLAELASVAAYVSRLRAEQLDSDLIEGATLELAGEQALVNRNRLKELIDIESQLVDVLGEIALTQDELSSLLNEYNTFLISHVLWVPSHSPMGKGALKQLGLDLRQNIDQVKSIRFNLFDVTAALCMVIGLASFWQRQRLIKGRKALNQRTVHPRNDSVQHTFFAFYSRYCRPWQYLFSLSHWLFLYVVRVNPPLSIPPIHCLSLLTPFF